MVSCAILDAVRSLNEEDEIKKIEKRNKELKKAIQEQNLQNLKLNQLMGRQMESQVIIFKNFIFF